MCNFWVIPLNAAGLSRFNPFGIIGDDLGCFGIAF